MRTNDAFRILCACNILYNEENNWNAPPLAVSLDILQQIFRKKIVCITNSLDDHWGKPILSTIKTGRHNYVTSTWFLANRMWVPSITSTTFGKPHVNWKWSIICCNLSPCSIKLYWANNFFLSNRKSIYLRTIKTPI